MMGKLISAVLLVIGLSRYAFSFDYNNLYVKDLPPPLAQNFLDMVRTSLRPATVSCPNPPKGEAEFHLYTRSNRNDPINLNPDNPQEVDPTKHTVIATHGWILGPEYNGFQRLKDAYLDRYDCNLIIVDWSDLAMQNYTATYCDLPALSDIVADFLCELSEHSVALSDVHLIGFSTGSHIFGSAGYKIKSKCSQQVGRLSALDLLDPYFMRLPETQRFSKQSAKFTDVLHTDMIRFGHMFKVGHTDFHANCALPQPGCPSYASITAENLVVDGICSHLRSLEFWIESVSSSDFVSVSCGMCSHYCSPDIINEKYAVMGEDCKAVPSGAVNFLVYTNDKPPYARG